MMKTKLCIIIFLTFCSDAFSQVLSGHHYFKDTTEISRFSEEVMKAFERFEIKNAYDLIRKKWPFALAEIDQLEVTTSDQLPAVKERFGNISGYEFVRNTRVNNFLYRKIYVLKFEKHLLPFYFTFYKSPEGWIINGYKYNDAVEELLE